MEAKLFQTNYGNLLKKALDVYTRQHEAISRNVSNVNNKEYTRTATDFSSELQEKVDQGRLQTPDSRHLQRSRFGAARLRSEPVAQERVDLNREMADLASNQIRHELVARSLQRYFSGLSAAIRGRNG